MGTPRRAPGGAKTNSRHRTMNIIIPTTSFREEWRIVNRGVVGTNTQPVGRLPVVSGHLAAVSGPLAVVSGPPAVVHGQLRNQTVMGNHVVTADKVQVIYNFESNVKCTWLKFLYPATIEKIKYRVRVRYLRLIYIYWIYICQVTLPMYSTNSTCDLRPITGWQSNLCTLVNVLCIVSSGIAYNGIPAEFFRSFSISPELNYGTP